MHQQAGYCGQGVRAAAPQSFQLLPAFVCVPLLGQYCIKPTLVRCCARYCIFVLCGTRLANKGGGGWAPSPQLQCQVLEGAKLSPGIGGERQEGLELGNINRRQMSRWVQYNTAANRRKNYPAFWDLNLNSDWKQRGAHCNAHGWTTKSICQFTTRTNFNMDAAAA